MPSTSTDTTTPPATDDRATDAATPTVPKPLAFAIDDACLHLDHLGDVVEILRKARTGEEMMLAYQAVTAKADAAKASGHALDGFAVIDRFRMHVSYDALAHRLQDLEDELAEAAQRLRKVAEEHRVGLSRRV